MLLLNLGPWVFPVQMCSLVAFDSCHDNVCFLRLTRIVKIQMGSLLRAAHPATAFVISLYSPVALPYCTVPWLDTDMKSRKRIDLSIQLNLTTTNPRWNKPNRLSYIPPSAAITTSVCNVHWFFPQIKVAYTPAPQILSVAICSFSCLFSNKSP